jgi:hypothetical protein
MKKIMSLMLGLSLLLGAASVFAEETTKTQKTTKPKVSKAKKAKKTATSTEKKS